MPASTTPPSNDRVLRRVLVCFAVIGVVLVAVVAVAVRSLDRSEAGADWVNHTHAVILEIDEVLTGVHAGDSALRTFLMTGDARDQAAAREAFAATAEHLEIAKALTRDEAAPNAQVLRLASLASQRADLAQRVFAAWPGDRAGAVRTLVSAEAGVPTTGEIRRLVERLKADEMALLATRDTVAYLQAQRTRWTIWTGVSLDSLLLAGVAWLLRDDLRARRQTERALEEANAQLETKVQERTTELATANASLTVENLEQRWAHQAAEHQLRYHQIVFNALNDPVFVVTKALSISRVNSAAVTLTGREPPTLIDHPLAGVVRLAGDSAAQLGALTRALGEGRELRAQPALVIDAQDRPIAVHLTLFPVRDRDKVVGGVVVLKPVTDSTTTT